SAVRWGAEPRITPRSGPGPGWTRVERVERCVVARLLVADERAISRIAAVDARLPAGLPIDFVAAHEDEIEAGAARRCDIGARRRVPILVMPGRCEDPMLPQKRR